MILRAGRASLQRLCGHGVARLIHTATGRTPHLTLFTGTHCSLCDDMKEVLDGAASRSSFTLSTYNIRDDASPNVRYWRRKYQYDIPVLHIRWDAPAHENDYGEEIARHRLDPLVLAKALHIT